MKKILLIIILINLLLIGCSTKTTNNNLKILTVNINGDGTGIVVSSPVGINCGNICNSNFNKNTIVTLTAKPDKNSAFEK